MRLCVWVAYIEAGENDCEACDVGSREKWLWVGPFFRRTLGIVLTRFEKFIFESSLA